MSGKGLSGTPFLNTLLVPVLALCTRACHLVRDASDDCCHYCAIHTTECKLQEWALYSLTGQGFLKFVDTSV